MTNKEFRSHISELLARKMREAVEAERQEKKPPASEERKVKIRRTAK